MAARRIESRIEKLLERGDEIKCEVIAKTLHCEHMKQLR